MRLETSEHVAISCKRSRFLQERGHLPSGLSPICAHLGLPARLKSAPSPSHSTSPRMPTPRSSYFTTTPYTCRMIKLVYAERVTFSHVYRSVHHGCYDPRRQLRSVTGSVERSPEPLPLREAAGSRQTHRALIGPLHHARTNSNKRYNDIYLYVNNDIYLHHAFKAVWVSGCHTGLIPMMR